MTRILASTALATSLAVALVLLLLHTTSAQQPAAQLTVLDRADEPVTALVDGNRVRFAIELARVARQPITISFQLGAPDGLSGGSLPGAVHLAECGIPRAGRGCTTSAVTTLGWYWDGDAQVRPQRVLRAFDAAAADSEPPLATRQIGVSPRPVVLVHGFAATYNTWKEYLGPSGFLAQAGLHGFAVGDGQVTGTMHTGKLLQP